MNQKIYNLIILDASGSMYSIRNEAIAGVVETIQTIRTAQEENADQEQMLSLVVFNGKHIATVYDRMPITKVSDFNEKDYQPTDNTDGYENASREWNHQRVFQLVENLKKKNWLFTYIGANQDALAVARDMGIDHSMNFMSDAEGTKAMFMKEKRSRKAFYDKLARGMSFKKAMSEEDYFVDDNEDA